MHPGAARVLSGGSVLALLAVVGGCGPSIGVMRLVPAPYNLGPARRLVLVEAAGSHGARARAASQFLEDVRADGLFTIADATHEGVPLSTLGEGEAARTAKGFRADWPADVYARIEVTNLSSWKKSETRKEKTKSGEEVDKVRFWAEATSALDVRLVDARTGQLLADYRASGVGRSGRRDGWEESLRREAEEHALDAAVRHAVDEFTPRRVSEILPLEKEAPDAEAGIARIEAGDLRGAQRLWEGTLAKFPDDPRLRYNLGAVSEALGNFRTAADYYEDAVRLAPGEVRYRDALSTLERRRRDAEALRTRG